MAILLVNNYLRRPEAKIKRYIKVLGELTDEEIKVIRFQDVKPDLDVGQDVEAIILSGSEACLSRPEDRPFFTGLMGFLRKTDIPVLGICFGHQLLGFTFGAPVVDMGHLVKEAKEVVVEVPDDVFASWRPGDKILVAESHRDKLERLPQGFLRLATSSYCEIEAMKHINRPIYGVQFHPERKPEPWLESWDGLEVLRNFLASLGLAREA